MSLNPFGFRTEHARLAANWLYAIAVSGWLVFVGIMSSGFERMEPQGWLVVLGIPIVAGIVLAASARMLRALPDLARTAIAWSAALLVAIVAAYLSLRALDASVDEFNKVTLATVALVAVWLGPYMQWRVARRQIADSIGAKRQVWIDGLRADAAAFLAAVGEIQELKRPTLAEALGEIKCLEQRMAREMTAKEIYTRIRLRLNPAEAAHNRLIELVKDMGLKQYDVNRTYSPEEERAAAAEFGRASDAIVDQLQSILKQEWERVKAGRL